MLGLLLVLKFNGPHKDVFYSGECFRIGGSNDIVTTINNGWREICFDCGNHFICKEEYAQGFIDLFKGMECFEIICDGVETIQATNFADKLELIADKYYKQK